MPDHPYKGLTIPIVNLNGTSRAELIRGYINALNECDALMTCLRSITPHGRDYQGATVGAYQKAHDEHMRRLRMVTEIHDEIDYIASRLGSGSEGVT